MLLHASAGRDFFSRARVSREKERARADLLHRVAPRKKLFHIKCLFTVYSCGESHGGGAGGCI